MKINAALNELYLYGVISENEISAKWVIDQLKALNTNKTIKVHINSPGGDVIQGIAIYNKLLSLNCEVHIDGLAASIASVIAMAGKKVYMAGNSFLMIHKPWSGTAGDSEELRKVADLLDRIEPVLLDAYKRRAVNVSADDLQAMLSAETWLDAEQALQMGFIDGITDPLQMAAACTERLLASAPDKFKAGLAQEQARVSGIRELLAMMPGTSLNADTLIKNGSTIEQARAELMTALGANAFPTGGTFVMTASPIKDFLNDARDAILIRHNVRVKDATAGAKDLVRLSVTGLAEKFLNLHGVSVSTMDRRTILNQAMSFNASHSTSDFTLLLGNTLGKSLRLAYEEETGSHEAWTNAIEVPDFKTQTILRLSEAPDLDLVQEGGEYKHGSMNDDAETFSIAKYGKMFGLTYEALVNDDLAAFTRLPQAFGKSAKRKETDLVYQVLTSNPALRDGVALFHATHKNLVSGTVGLTVEGLQAARLLMRKQKGVNGTAPINVVPRYLIVPAALETLAEQLLYSLVDPSKTNPNTPNLDFIRGLTLVVDSRLDDSSAVSYYLAADPSQVDTITRAYLAGAGRPSYEVKDGWEVDGMTVKARLEVAAVPLDFRGLVKVPA